MKINTFAKGLAWLVVLLVAGPLFSAAGAAMAEEAAELPEKYRARAMSVDRGAARYLDIVIQEWTTAEERAALLKAFQEGGSKALYSALFKQEDKGYVKMARTLGYDMKYAWQFEHEGKRHIVMATDRPFGFVELQSNSRSTDYNVSLVVLNFDPESGEGEGYAAAGVEISVDEKTGQLQIKYTGTRPTQLVKVKRLDNKK